MLEFIIKYWVQVLFGLVVSLIGVIYRRLVAYQKQQIALQDGMKALLHDRIIQKCKEYLDQGEITDNDLDEIYYMNEPYKELGGNGTVKTMITKVEKLKVK